MIETEQTVTIDRSIESIWDYVRDIARWANLMPGMREFAVEGEDDSRWTLKVGVGGLVRTVNVLVHVDQWDGPERAVFSYRLDGDPVEGGGAYSASRLGPHVTEVALKMQVEGSGPMAPMWEAMGRPLLPQLAKAFAGQLKDEIEKAIPAAEPEPAAAAARRSVFAAVAGWLRKIWRDNPIARLRRA